MLANITHTFVNYLSSISEIIPLPWFALLGSIVEEIIAPIPSPLVMTLAGSIAAARNHAIIYLVFVALAGTAGKTLASYLMYVIADKFEDVVLTKFGKFLGVSHREIERIGSRLNKGWRDDILLVVLRAIPIIPSAPISIVSGLIKLNVRTFIISTFIGTAIRNMVYLIVGYTGRNATESFITTLEDFEIVGYIAIGLLVVLIAGYVLFQRNKEKILHRIFDRHNENKQG